MPRGNYYHYSVEEKIDLINEFYESGLSANKFCSMKKMYPTTFGKWIKKYQESLANPTPGFLDVTSKLTVPSTVSSVPANTPPALLSTGMTSSKAEIREAPDQRNKNDIRLKTPNGFELSFDISIIKDVLEAIS